MPELIEGLHARRTRGVAPAPDDALLTTDPDNLASRRVIEKCGGRLVEENSGHCYYRLRTVAAVDGAAAIGA